MTNTGAGSLKDLVVRTGTNALVTDLVNLDHVRSMLKTISYRRRYSAMRQQAQAATADHGTIISLDGHVRNTDSFISSPSPLADVPEIIVVEDTPSTPPPVSSRDITSANRHSTGLSWTEPETPTRQDHFGLSDSSPLGGSSPSRGLRRDRRESDMSALSADFGLRYTYVLRPYRIYDGLD